MALMSVWISSPDTHSERRIAPHLSVSQLKFKLEPITGIPASTQLLTLRRTGADAGHSGSSSSVAGGDVLAVLGNDNKTLDSYGLREYMTIRVDSNDPHARGLAGQYTDDSQVDKFELTEEEYAARRDTVLQFKKRNQLGRFAPPPPSSSAPPSALPADLAPGARCEVALSPELSRRGTVRFVGPTEFGAKDDSVWVGVEWDEPVGKGDGPCVLALSLSLGSLPASTWRPALLALELD
ncbi:hypothetical protein JCM9279_000635 [Rhodotorula babjevae]